MNSNQRPPDQFSTTNEDSQTIVASKALENEIREFCTRSNLTPRESEIVAIMVEGVVRIKDVADRLGLSPNTINNHVNSIFMKTRTRSKSQLLANLLNSVAEELQSARFFRQCPRVLLVERDMMLANTLAQVLEAKSFRVSLARSRAEAEAKLANFGPHFVVADLPTLGDAKTFMNFVWDRLPAQIVFLGVGGGFRLRCEAMGEGAVDVLTKPVDVVRLLKTLMLQYIEEDADRLRYLDQENAEVIVGRNEIVATKQTLGVGGIYLSAADLEKHFSSTVGEGDVLEMRIRVGPGEQSPITARGMIVWKRPSVDGPPGCGVKFTHVTKPDRERLSIFLRENEIRAFIPPCMTIVS